MSYKSPILTTIYNAAGALLLVGSVVTFLEGLRQNIPNTGSLFLYPAVGLAFLGIVSLGLAQLVSFIAEIAYNTRILADEIESKADKGPNGTGDYTIPGIG